MVEIKFRCRTREANSEALNQASQDTSLHCRRNGRRKSVAITRRMVFILTVLAGLGVMQTRALAQDETKIPKKDVDKSVWVANFLEKAKSDWTLIAEAKYLVEAYKVNPNLEYGEVGTTLADAERALRLNTYPGQTEFDVADTLIGTLSSATAIGKFALPIYDGFLKTDLKEALGRDDRVMREGQRYELWEMTRTQKGVEFAEQLYDLATRNFLARDSLEKALSPRLNASFLDNAKTILKNNSGINHPVLDKIQMDGSLLALKSDLLKYVQDNHNEVMGVLAEDRQFLSKLDQDQSILIDWVNDQVKRQQAQDEAEAQAKQHQQRLDAANSAVYLLSTFVGFGDKKLGHEIAVAGGAAIQLADGLSKFTKAAAAIDTSTKLSAALGSTILAGNVVGMAMQIFSMFGDSGPSADELILQQLQELSMQISQVRVEMHERFDRVDKSLDKIFLTIVTRFDQVDWQLGRVNAKVDEIQKELFGLHSDLNKLQTNVYAFLDDGFRMELHQAINGYLGYLARTGQRITFSDYAVAENLFQTWATVFAADQLRAGAFTRDYTDRGAYDEMGDFPLAFNFNYLSQYPYQVLGLAPLFPNRLANPMDLATAAEAWLQLAKENPDHAKSIAAYRLQQIKDMLLELKAAVANSTNKTLYAALLKHHTRAVDPVGQAVEDIVHAYITNPANGIQKVDIWGPADQSINDPLAQTTIDDYGGRVLNYRISDRLKNSFDIPNLCRNARYLGLGDITFFLEDNGITDVSWRPMNARKTIWGAYLKAYVVIRVQFAGNLIDRRWVKSREFLDHEDYGHLDSNGNLVHTGWARGDDMITLNWDGHHIWNWLDVNWDRNYNMLSLFEASSLPDMTADEINARAPLLDSLQTRIKKVFRSHQIAIYQQVVSELSSTSTMAAASRALSGTSRVIAGIGAFSLPRSLEQNDFLRALLYGKERILDTDAIQDVYSDAIGKLQVEQDVPKVDISAVASQRVNALAGVLDNILTRIGNGQFAESDPLVETMLRKIDAYDSTRSVAIGQPADINRDWILRIGEVVSYAAAWKKGQTWLLEPNPVPINYVTNAALIWKKGEVYHLDGSQAEPACWVPGATGRSRARSLSTGKPGGEMLGGKRRPIGTAALYSNSNRFTPGVPVRMTLIATLAPTSMVYAVEEHLPSGWKVTSVDGGGQLDPKTNELRWGPFMDSKSRTFNFVVVPCAAKPDPSEFKGFLSVDGDSVPVMGPSNSLDNQRKYWLR